MLAKRPPAYGGLGTLQRSEADRRSGRRDHQRIDRQHDRPPAPLPCSLDIEDKNNACFVVKDANGFAVAYVNYEVASLMTRDEARRIAANLTKLPELLLRAGASSLKDTASAPVYRRGTGYYATMQRALDDNRPMTAEAGRDAQAVGECRLRARRI
jgi:hypothetical protein